MVQLTPKEQALVDRVIQVPEDRDRVQDRVQ
jgi:hypothetical protein